MSEEAQRQDRTDSALEAVFMESADDVVRLCGAVVGDEEVEEVLRRVARAAAGGLARGEISSNPKRWLLRLAYSEAVGAGAAAETPQAEALQARPKRVPVWKREAAAAADEPAFEDGFASLGRTQRGALALRELSNLGYGAIADVLRIDPATARECVTKARLALQPHLPREGPMCDRARRLMADDQLDPAAAGTLSAHLATCSECPPVERSMRDLGAALDKALPHIAEAVLLAVLKEAAAHASEGQGQAQEGQAPGPESPPRRERRARRPSRALVVAGLAVLLVTASALGLAASSLDRTRDTRGTPPLLVPQALLDAGVPGLWPLTGDCLRGEPPYASGPCPKDRGDEVVDDGGGDEVVDDGGGDEVGGYVDRHGDRHGRGHSPGHGRGHDVDHVTGHMRAPGPTGDGDGGAAAEPAPATKAPKEDRGRLIPVAALLAVSGISLGRLRRRNPR